MKQRCSEIVLICTLLLICNIPGSADGRNSATKDLQPKIELELQSSGENIKNSTQPTYDKKSLEVLENANPEALVSYNQETGLTTVTERHTKIGLNAQSEPYIPEGLAQASKVYSLDSNGNKIIKDISQETIHAIKSVDDVIAYSNTVVLATVLNAFPLGNQVTKYTVLIDKEFKGNTEDRDIDVYEAEGTLESGKQYLLFLGKHDSALFPRTNYTSILKDCIIEVNMDKSLKNNNFVKDLNSISSLVSESETSGNLAYNDLSSVAPVVNKYKNIQELIQAADFILHVTVNDVSVFHEYVSGVSVEVIDSYKGVTEKTDFMLPTGKVEKEKEYFLFLKAGESNTVELASREGSIISNSDSDIWNNALNVLESIRQ